MARARKVEADVGLEAAVLAFWRSGFRGLGTRQMEAETGITRFSLQTEHGGKRQLFLKALDAYLDRFEVEIVPDMADGTLESLARWFEARSAHAVADEDGPWGCLMINSIVEMGSTDPDLQARSERFFAMLRRGFHDALGQIQSKGALSPIFDIDASVELLVSASIGLNVVIRSVSDVESAQPVSHGIATMVRSWAVS